ncbi:MAG: phosphatase PAP2 family protein [Cyclobacteriaceae bacterium]
MEEILEFDKELFLDLNSYHNEWLDQLMMFFSSTPAWIPLYLILLYAIIRIYKKNTWVVLFAATITILLADQITSSFMKPFFERLRPSHEPELAGVVNIVDQYRGGKYGFASSHAGNTFGVATLMWIFLKDYRPWIGILFFWALFVGYTRIYLGVHYPGDILVGQLIGFLSALAAYFLSMLIKKFIDRQRALRSGSQ